MDTDYKILVIVVSYNGAAIIDGCLSPLFPCGPAMRVLLVDNGSADGTADYVRAHYPCVEVLQTGKNLGFGAANNIAFRYAFEHGFDYVYLLNQDARIAPEDIVRLAGINAACPEYGIISPLQVYAGGTRLDYNFSRTLPADLVNDCVLGLAGDAAVYVTDRSVQAAHWLISCDVLKKVGAFSPAFFHYGEDVNLCHRMRYHGYKVGIVPSVRAIHDREHREYSEEKELFLLAQRWRVLLSDPNVSNLQGCKEVIKSVRSSLRRFKFKLAGPFVKFCKEYGRLIKIKKRSLAEGCFFERQPRSCRQLCK